MDYDELTWYLREAQARWDSPESCRITNDALIAANEKGAWVEAWVWIDAPQYYDDDELVEFFNSEEGLSNG